VRAREDMARRTPLGEALAVARAAVAYLAGASDARDLSFAGSLRRCEPLVGDVDLVCSATHPAAVLRAFVAWERAASVIGFGETKGSLRLADGLQLDLRVVAPECYGNLLQHMTGSKEHNIQLRERAVRMGHSVSEYGITELASGTVFTARTEAEVYARLGLPNIPPEMRLGLGEIEAAAAGALPAPLELADLRGDFHMHTTWSDGTDSLEAMIAAAAARGYAYHAISDHSPSRGRYGNSPERLRAQAPQARSLAKRYGIATLCASEVDIKADGSLDFDDAFLAELDLAIASVHDDFHLDRAAMTRRLVRACEHPFVTIIGHPTGRQVGSYPGYAFDEEEVFRAAARTGTALELDGQPNRLDLPSNLARHAREFGVTFALDSDAHSVAQLANVAFSVGQARRAWITRDQVLGARSLADVRAFIARKRRAKP
ncbi:MAG: PHP domain-containing protein, partial [Vulcanimicrobiaceae bacterium]